MITLSILVYLIVSLIIAIFHKHQEDCYGNSYNHTWKESLSFGFLILPCVAIFLSIVVGIGWCILYLFMSVLEGAAWIYYNMP